MRMAHKITILQFRTDVSLDHEKKCFLKFLGMQPEDIKFIHMFDGPWSYEKIGKFLAEDTAPLIVAGSGQYYLGQPNDTPKMQADVDSLKAEFYPILRDIIAQNDRYIFGICFGHQIIVDLYGSLIADPAQAETGVFEVNLTNEGVLSPLFEGVREPYHVVLGHKDSAHQLPEGSTILSYSERCQVQALQITEKVYSVQYHPELTLPELKERLKLYPGYTDNTSDDSMNDDVHDITQAPKIMKNFLKMAGLM